VGPDQRTKIIMVPGRSDKDQVVACVHSGCDAYIAKPFNLQLVCAKMEMIGLGGNNPKTNAPPKAATPQPVTADTIFNDISQALRKGDLELPMQPEICVKFRRLVEAEANREQIGELLQTDMTISSKLIRMANSGPYRGLSTILNVTQAIGRIGIAATTQMVTALSNQGLYASGLSKYKEVLRNLWLHSLASAYAAELLAEPMRQDLSIDPFVAGLLHDIGGLALVQIVAEMEKRGRYSRKISAEALAETLQNYHATFGAKLLLKWNFTPAYAQATLNHAKWTDEVKTHEDAVVHLANLMAKEAGYAGVQPAQDVELAQTPSARHLQLDKPQLDLLLQKTKEHMAASSELAPPI
ncbi:MAG: HDOD domain-containing protein, partial [Desulfatitalea sp.]